jgi:hypothetical protein
MKPIDFNTLKKAVAALLALNAGAVYAGIDGPLPPTQSQEASASIATTLSSAGTSITITVPQSSGTVTVTMADEDGFVMYQTTENTSSGAKQLTIDTLGWESGTYIVSVTNSAGVVIYETLVFVP